MQSYSNFQFEKYNIRYTYFLGLKNIMADEDEDLILYNSPLDEYLQQVTDLPFRKYDFEDDLNSYQKENNFEEETDNKYDLTLKIKKYMLFYHQNIEAVELLQSCQILLKSELLSEEDEYLLRDLNEEIKQDLVHHGVNKRTTDVNSKYLQVGFLILLMSVLLPILMLVKTYEDLFAFILLLIVVASVVYYYYRTYFKKNLPKELHVSITRFSAIIFKYNNLINKAMRHVKEVEVISLGYTTMKSILPYDPTKGKKCLKLRNCLMDGLFDIFMQIRTSQRLLLQGGIEHQLLCDYKEEYIASISLDVFSEILSVKKKDSETGLPFIQLEELKKVICLYKSQLSELVYKTIVDLYTVYKGKVTENNLIQEIIYLTSDLTKNIRQAVRLLDEHLHASVKLIFQRQKLKAPKSVQNNVDLKSFFHSSELHLYAALNRIDEMKCLIKQHEELEKSPSELFSGLIVQFNLALENAKCCIQDAGDIVNPRRIKSKVTDNNHIDGNISARENTDDNVVFHEPIKIDGDVLFEGESDTHQIREVSMENIEEFERSLKESKDSKKLLRELKSVFAVKDSPVGLLKFPLNKASHEEISDSDEENKEYVCGQEKQLNSASSIENHKQRSDYSYEPNEYSSDNGDEILSQVQVVRIGLPVGFTQASSNQGMMEETYGSSNDENDEEEEEKDSANY